MEFQGVATAEVLRTGTRMNIRPWRVDRHQRSAIHGGHRSLVRRGRRLWPRAHVIDVSYLHSESLMPYAVILDFAAGHRLRLA